MKFSKCKWFNDHQTACSLMIDDLVPAAVSLDGQLGPYNDWGYLMDRPDSLFSFFKRNLLEKYPEIRGTFFLPLESQHSIPEGSGYTVFKRDIDDEYVEFTKKISNTFELAFHGIRHTYLEDGSWIFEFEDPEAKEFELFKSKIDHYAAKEIVFNGGKFPGYKCNEKAIDFVRQENFKWLALSAGMVNKKHAGNELVYVSKTRMVNIPTNVSGDIFNEKAKRAGSLKRTLRHLLFPGGHFKPEEYLEYLYSQGHPITIQEHFQNQRPDGRRQTPNIYDDIYSLDRIFALLHPRDIWYAKCSEIAHYYDSYKNASIIEKENCEFEIHYQGNWDGILLSFKTNTPILNDLSSGRSIQGIAKNGVFVFNNLKAGSRYSCQ